MKTPAQRPLAYHKRSQREPWILALRRLYRNGWPDWRIAEALSALSAHQIKVLENNRCWNWRCVEEVLVPGAGPSWTERQVEYHRRALGLAGKHHRHECRNLVRTRHHKTQQACARLLAEEFGWKILMVRGLDWGLRAIQVLLLLRDRGPLSLDDLAVILGLSGSRPLRRAHGTGTVLGQLLSLGLVEVESFTPHGARRYRLTPAAQPGGTRLCTSVEVQAARVGVA